MKEGSWCLLVSIFIVLVPLAEVSASTLGCGSVDGASIFGYDGSHYKFIGAISNEYDSNSIANEYGAGSEYNSDSIMDKYGEFGSEYSSESAFNDYTSSPPILVDSSSHFIGYLTTNEYLSPSINTYAAIACAKETYASSDSSMEGVVFKDVPDGASYSGYSGYIPAVPAAATCPANSSNINGTCTCSAGYVADKTKSICIVATPQYSCPANSIVSGDKCVCSDGYLWNGSLCVTYTQSCQSRYGINSYGDSQKCYCSANYKFNTSNTACEPVSQPTTQDSQARSVTTQGDEYFSCDGSKSKLPAAGLCNQGYKPVCDSTGSVLCEPVSSVAQASVATPSTTPKSEQPTVKKSAVKEVQSLTQSSNTASSSIMHTHLVPASASSTATKSEGLFGRLWYQVLSWFIK